MLNKIMSDEPVCVCVCVCVLQILIMKDKVLPFFWLQHANTQFLMKIHRTPATLWQHTSCRTLS
jgi:hypothetical protein